MAYARRLRRRSGPVGDTWHLDELFGTIRGPCQYLWRAVDQDGEVLDILLQPRRDCHAAARFFRKLLKRSGRGQTCGLRNLTQTLILLGAQTPSELTDGRRAIVSDLQ